MPTKLSLPRMERLLGPSFHSGALPGTSLSDVRQGPGKVRNDCLAQNARLLDLARFHETFGRPAYAILLFDLGRSVELIYALERARDILSGALDHEDTQVPHLPRDGEGDGLVEAPRGPLIRHYRIENGLISQAQFIRPTVHNSLAIERALRVAAERYITAERVGMELERSVGRVVRPLEPCVPCATH
jgi:F420-non-reducing hydrogenase large subunit